MWPEIGAGPAERAFGGCGTSGDSGVTRDPTTRAARASCASEIAYRPAPESGGWPVYVRGPMGPFVEEDGGGYEDARVSPWHDVGLFAGQRGANAKGGASPREVRCVVEAAAGGEDGAGGRVDLRADGNPLVRCSHFPPGPRAFALGVLPQTFENPRVEDRLGPGVGLRGDEDLLRAVVLGSATREWAVGEVRQVRAVTAVGFADRARGVRAWTVVCVDPGDAGLGGVLDAVELEAAAGPSALESVRDFAGWGGLESLGDPLDAQATLQCVDRSHREWAALSAGYWTSLSDTYAMWTTQPAGHWSHEPGRRGGADGPSATPIRGPQG